MVVFASSKSAFFPGRWDYLRYETENTVGMLRTDGFASSFRRHGAAFVLKRAKKERPVGATSRLVGRNPEHPLH